MTPALRARAESALRQVTDDLLRELDTAGHWIGELSSSALSTAVATIALGESDRQSKAGAHAAAIQAGLHWLAEHANSDGGWGDTPRSRSNLSTTALAWAAFGAAQADPRFPDTVRRACDWLLQATGSWDNLVTSIEGRYGEDRTFSVPIVLTLALSGRLGPSGWRKVRPLPFELAALPRSWFGALRLPVVSYALPALIALGQAIHVHAPSPNPLTRLLRRRVARSTLDLLETLQPVHGGFLEATPLTAFVAMSLASIGLARHPVAARAAAFLRASQRVDGSWPIDTNLATWVTTLAIKALHHQPHTLDHPRAGTLRSWLLDQQYRVPHPYTGAAPGGWAWTDLPGGVPDADDTSGALLALHALGPRPDDLPAAIAGIQWLLNLQNRDGGIPTFCRGWGRLPFDRSAPDLTAHALRAWTSWTPRLPPRLQARIRRAARGAHGYLRASQRADGAWLPLWFGNEHVPDDVNPLYGTAQVLLALGPPAERTPRIDALRQAGAAFLRGTQHPDGGWGGALDAPPSIEETSLALSALTTVPPVEDSLSRGLHWLLNAIECPEAISPSPIGLYFARLWYSERLYPRLFAADALGRVLHRASTAH